MNLVKNLIFLYSLLKTSIKASMSMRGAFLFESGLMLANNLIFFSLWWIFFRQFQSIGEWQLKDMITLMAVGSGAYGLMLICFGGIRFISRSIISGDLDPFMTQPKNLLLHLMGSRSLARGWGDLSTMVLLVVFGGLWSPQTILLILVGSITGCLVFSSMSVIAHSLAFWLGPIENLAKQYCDSLLVFSFYPQNIYTGVLKILMFTVIPAGIVGYLPVEMIRDFTWTKLLILLGSAALFCLISFTIFHLGLKRYESGNQFGTRH
jgi:ABC-2 type transport system permease protein